MVFIIVLFLFLAVGLKADSEETVFVAIMAGIFIGTCLQLCWSDGKARINNTKLKKRMQEQIKEQEKYDNDYGIIDYEDK